MTQQADRENTHLETTGMMHQAGDRTSQQAKDMTADRGLQAGEAYQQLLTAFYQQLSQTCHNSKASGP